MARATQPLRQGVSRSHFSAISKTGALAVLSFYTVAAAPTPQSPSGHGSTADEGVVSPGSPSRDRSTVLVNVTNPTSTVVLSAASDFTGADRGSLSAEANGSDETPPPAGGGGHGDFINCASVEKATSLFHANIVQYLSCAVVSARQKRLPRPTPRDLGYTPVGPAQNDSLFRSYVSAATDCNEVSAATDELAAGLASAGMLSALTASSSPTTIEAAPLPLPLPLQSALAPSRYFCVVEEFVPGGTLRESVSRYDRPLPLAAVRRYSVTILRALEYLHSSEGLVHGLLSPRNVLVSVQGACKIKGMRVLFDWAKGDPELHARLTEPIACYSSPEVNISGEVTFAADIFSFGLILLEMLTGENPWTWAGALGPSDLPGKSREELSAVLGDNKVFLESLEQGSVELQQYGEGRNVYNLEIARYLGAITEHLNLRSPNPSHRRAQKNAARNSSSDGAASISGASKTESTFPAAFGSGAGGGISDTPIPLTDAGGTAAADLALEPLSPLIGPYGLQAASGASLHLAARLQESPSCTTTTDPAATSAGMDRASPAPVLTFSKDESRHVRTVNEKSATEVSGHTAATLSDHHSSPSSLQFLMEVALQADPAMLSLLDGCLLFDPRARKTASQLLQILSEY